MASFATVAYPEYDLVCSHCTYKNPPDFSPSKCGMCSNSLKRRVSPPIAVHSNRPVQPGFTDFNRQAQLHAVPTDLGANSGGSVLLRTVPEYGDRTGHLIAERHDANRVKRTDSQELSYNMGVSREEARKIIAENNLALSRLELDAGGSGAGSNGNHGAMLPVAVVVDSEHGGGGVFPAAQVLYRSESEKIADDLGVSRSHARQMIEENEAAVFRQERMREQSRRDQEFAMQQSKIVEKQCALCLEEYAIEDMYTLDCPSSHRFCLECVRRGVGFQLQEQKVPTCPMKCGHSITTKEIVELYGRSSAEHSKFETILLNNTLEGDPTLFLKCPRPDCKDYCLAEVQGAKERCICPTCKYEYCSLCRGLYHHKLSCAEVPPTAESWFRWIREDSGKFRKDYAKATETRQALKEAESAFKDLQKDEAWKEQHCRLCPHCKKCVYRVDGCDSMTCGRDAADKGGGNRQDGCGKKFNWKRAKPYRRGADRMHLPKGLDEVDLELAKETSHYVILRENVPSGATLEQFRMNCDVCREPIKGPRFACIHCPNEPNLCLKCEGSVTNENNPGVFLPNHTSQHIFQIYFETSFPAQPSAEWVMLDGAENGRASAGGKDDPDDRKRTPAEERSSVEAAFKYAADFFS